MYTHMLPLVRTIHRPRSSVCGSGLSQAIGECRPSLGVFAVRHRPSPEVRDSVHDCTSSQQDEALVNGHSPHRCYVIRTETSGLQYAVSATTQEVHKLNYH